MGDLLARLQSALGDAYRIEKELGGGGMSRLFLATEASLHRQVVIKLLPPEFASEVSATRFRQEIEVAAHLQHTNILPVLTAGAKDDLLFYVMPFVSGESLRHRLTREGKLPVADAVRILHEIADALAHAHAEGVIHRDIKPENILLLGTHAVLTDFGVARALAESRSGGRLTDTGLVLGSPGYMSPEQAAGERNVDARADVYALAVVGYEMLAGFPPFAGPTAQAVIAAHLTATPKPLTDVSPETPPNVGNAIARGLAKDPNARLRTAAEFRDAIAAAAVARVRWRVTKVWVAALGVVGLAAVATVLAIRSRGAAPLDPNLVAVAPFNVLDPRLELWREGLVDVLSRNLDGAGALRIVPPSVAIKASGPHADATTAAELGRRTGARLVIVGTLTSEGPDSARLSADVLDVRSGRVVGEVERRDLSNWMNRLADSLTIGLLRAIGGVPSGALPRFGAVGTASLPALRAFLQGEQYFRRTAWDSALASYERAVTIDSGFALAWRRMSTVLGWARIGGDSLSLVYGLRSAALNRGLSPRESLLIVAESLSDALYTSSSDHLWRAHQARLFTTLEEATRHYPEDPDAWYELGDARFHFHLVGRTSEPQALEGFDHAIAADSTFGEAYIHTIALALDLYGPTTARRYVAGYLAHASGYKDAASIRLADRVLAAGGVQIPDIQATIDSASAEVLFAALQTLIHWPDSNETAVRLARALVSSSQSATPLWVRKLFLAGSLAHRGHLREAWAVGGSRAYIVPQMAPLGGVPADSAAAFFNGYLRDPLLREPPNPVPLGFNVELFNALPWWAVRRDTAALNAFARKFETLSHTGRYSDLQPWLRYGVASARAYRTLARGDTADALRRFLALPDTICPCVYDEIVAAQLLLAAGRPRDASAVFERQYPPWGLRFWVASGLWYLQRARVAEQLGQRREALADYRKVTALWRNADPDLRPYVEEAKAALKRLGGEPR